VTVPVLFCCFLQSSGSEADEGGDGEELELALREKALQSMKRPAVDSPSSDRDSSY
jgi:hypothetical protein